LSTTISSPPLLTGNDLFVASLLSDGMKMNTDTNTTVVTKTKKALPTMFPKPTSLPSLTISPVSPVSSPSKTLIFPDGFGNINQLTTSQITTPLYTAKTIRRKTTHNSLVNLLHLVDSPLDIHNVAVRKSNRLLSPSSP
jgi:hypothetical protein